jgi:hypothetical protein
MFSGHATFPLELRGSSLQNWGGKNIPARPNGAFFNLLGAAVKVYERIIKTKINPDRIY